MKIKQSELRKLIKETIASKRKRAINESTISDLRDQLMKDRDIEMHVQELVASLVEFTGNDEADDAQTGETMWLAIYDALAQIIVNVGDVRSDEGPPPLPQG